MAKSRRGLKRSPRQRGSRAARLATTGLLGAPAAIGAAVADIDRQLVGARDRLRATSGGAMNETEARERATTTDRDGRRRRRRR